MSTILLYICRIEVLTKSILFKNFVSKILFFASVLFFLSSFNRPYPHPEYYTFESADGVIHKWSREICYDIYGTVEQTTDEVYKRWSDQENETEVNFLWSKLNYLDNRKQFKADNKRKEDSIMKREPFNLRLTLDKYCVK